MSIMVVSEDNIGKYLKHLQVEGWSDLVCIKWKDQVYQELIQKFPDMSEQEWQRIEKAIFV